MGMHLKGGCWLDDVTVATKMMRAWILRLADESQQRQIDEYLRHLRDSPSEGIGMVLAMSAHMRNRYLVDRGVDFLRPKNVTATDPRLVVTLVDVAKDFQRKGTIGLCNAAALMIWCHTLRATLNPRLTPKVLEMWRELARGFPYIEDGLVDIHQMTGEFVDLRDAGRFPSEFVPEFRSTQGDSNNTKLSIELEGLAVSQVRSRGWGLMAICAGCGNEKRWSNSSLDSIATDRNRVMFVEMLASRLRCSVCESRDVRVAPAFEMDHDLVCPR